MTSICAYSAILDIKDVAEVKDS